MKVKGRKKKFQANSNQDRAALAILVSDKIYFKSKKVYERQGRMLYIYKDLIQKEDITIKYIHRLNNRAPNEAKIDKTEGRNKQFHSNC